MSANPTTFTMAGLDPATQRARVCGCNESFRSLTLASWVAASRAAMVSWGIGGPAMVNGVGEAAP
jgi:hypothetical protein